MSAAALAPSASAFRAAPPAASSGRGGASSTPASSGTGGANHAHSPSHVRSSSGRSRRPTRLDAVKKGKKPGELDAEEQEYLDQMRQMREWVRLCRCCPPRRRDAT